MPLENHARENGKKVRCQSNLKQIMVGVAQYAQDFDERLPLSDLKAARETEAREPFGWVDALLPYLPAATVFQCPGESNADPNDPRQNGTTDYWFNARASGVAVAQISGAAQTIALGEGNDGQDRSDARYHLAAIPRHWLTDEKSPINRHLYGSNLAFADGHVKWFTSQKFGYFSDATSNNNPTLRLKFVY